MASATKIVPKIDKVIRLCRKGCTNRPFYHIVVQKRTDTQDGPVIEQVGSFDPIPNSSNEKLVAVNLARIRHWLGEGAGVSDPVAQLLGLSGFLPNHPRTLIQAWRNRSSPARETKLDPIFGIAPPPTNPNV
uniref:Small ribosomal subunit protein bS16m n=1 Tax=Moina brachiata TaxID=675436 RepID=A0A4Y7NLB5_9CRUS|nr:EOG090X0KAD [Moina brachiata]SVE93396.1 EOG090X0KAD [Moina brachiata]